MRRRLFIILLMLVPLAAGAQYIKLRGDTTRTALYLDLDKVWSYNLYEHSRWGAGFRVAWHPELFDRRITAFDIYAGYGIEDLQIKGGIGLLLPLTKKGTLTFGARRDYEGAGNRRMAGPSITDIGSLASFMSRRMVDRHMVSVGYSHRFDVETGVEVRVYHGFRLFDGTGLLYLANNNILPREDGAELRLTASSDDGWSGELRLGGILSDVPHGIEHTSLIARLLGQYDRTFRSRLFATTLFAQAGMAAPGTPYTHMFDLGGTMGAPLCFNRTLLTALPNEFTASVFSFASVRLSTAGSLWDVYSYTFSVGSSPVPFVQANMAWGALWGQDGNGLLNYEGLDLLAPTQGIAEALAGIEGIVRWGVADWGAAVAYRLTPPTAIYHRPDWHDNLSVVLTARLVF